MMNVEVHKYGGTSIDCVEKIKTIALRTLRYQAQHKVSVVLVLSAMGQQTDALLAEARSIAEEPDPAALDVLLATGEQRSCALMILALQSHHIAARFFSGEQAGLGTDACFGQARVESVNIQGIQSALKAGIIPVVAGYQGAAPNGQVTTLGRGGSDLSAVILANALDAPCLIYTDVEGIYTADPVLIRTARRLDSIHIDDMLKFSELGAQVLSPASVRYAKNNDVNVSVHAGHQAQSLGTQLTFESSDVSVSHCLGVIIDPEVTEITLTYVPDSERLQHLLRRFKTHGIVVDLLGTQIYSGADRRWVMTIPNVQLSWCLMQFKSEGCVCLLRSELARVSLVGGEVQSIISLAQSMLTQQAIFPIRSLTTSKRLTVLVRSEQAVSLALCWHRGLCGVDVFQSISDANVAYVES